MKATLATARDVAKMLADNTIDAAEVTWLRDAAKALSADGNGLPKMNKVFEAGGDMALVLDTLRRTTDGGKPTPGVAQLLEHRGPNALGEEAEAIAKLRQQPKDEASVRQVLAFL